LRVLIIGAGYVGGILAEKLSESGHSVTIIDKDDEKIARIGSRLDVEALVRDATNPILYDEIDINSFDIIVAVTDKDEVNLFVAAIAKLYGVERVFVRIRNPQTARILATLGVEGVIPEPQLVANILFSYIQGSYTVINLVPTMAGEFVLVSAKVRPMSMVRGKRVRDLLRNGRLPPHTRILAVVSQDRIMDPVESPPLDVEDLVVALVRRDKVKEFSSLF